MSKNKNPRLNSAGYPDPVAFKAIGRVIRQENEERRKSKQKSVPKVYICSPFRGDTEKNTANILRYCRFAVEQGYFPIAPHAYLPRFMDDDNPSERELALSFGIRLLGGCKELWIFGGEITEGMKREIIAAEKCGIKVIKFFNENLQEVTNAT